MSSFPAKSKVILEKVLQRRLTKAKAGRLLGVSRKTIYAWMREYQLDHNLLPPYQLVTRKPRNRKQLDRQVFQIAIATPGIGPKKIIEALAKQGEKWSVRSVWLSLKRQNLATREIRTTHAEKYRLPKEGNQLRLIPLARKQMVEDALLGGERPSTVITRLHISRKTFAKWKNRYLIAQQHNKTLLDALSDQHPTGSTHPRGVSKQLEEAVISAVIQNPHLSSHKIAQNLGTISNHGVQRILERSHLSHVDDRVRFRQEHASEGIVAPPPAPVSFWDRVRLVWDKFIVGLLAAPPPGEGVSKKKIRFIRSIIFSALISSVISFVLLSWFHLLGTYPQPQAIGMIFASVALGAGMIFFLYSLKYYIALAIVLSFSQKRIAGEGLPEEFWHKSKGFLDWILRVVTAKGKSKIGFNGPVGLEPNLSHIHLIGHPMVSVHIPLYNEKNVAERSVAAACNLDYPSYEVIIADDSSDSTPTIIDTYMAKFGTIRTQEGKGWTLTQTEIRRGVVLKHIHRTTRSGFKGAALALALEHTDPAAEFVSVFDADFVPYPDTLTLFLKYFKVQNHLSEDYTKSNVAVVQGYQWHVLNKSENWITRGVRGEYAGSYVIERAGEELYGGLKQISGSVYMIRRKPLEEVGWRTSITEDFELTLRLYEKGYKVVYTPYIQAPAECVSTLKRLIRQRMRWAEGHSFNVKKMLIPLLVSDKLSLAEKFEMAYLSPYYLQAFLFMLGTAAWLISETAFRTRLPFWTSLWGWSLVLTNMLSLPLTNTVGLFLEESEQKDYVGIASFVAVTYLLVPFQAYAALKGFLEKEEGPWFRTPKTGRITDVFTRGRFYRFISGIFTGGKNPAPSFAQELAPAVSPYLALATANSTFRTFAIRPSPRMRWVAKAALSILLAMTTTVLYSSRPVQKVYATDITNKFKLGIGTMNFIGEPWPSWGNALDNGTPFGSSGSNFFVFNNTCCNATTNNFKWYTNQLPSGNDPATIPSGTYTVNLAKALGPASANRLNYGIQIILASNNGTAENVILSNTTYWLNNTTGAPMTTSQDNTIVAHTVGSLASNISITSPTNRLMVRLYVVSVTHNTRTNLTWIINNATVQSQMVPPGTIHVPEIPKPIIFVVTIVFVATIPSMASLEVEKKGKRKGKGWIADLQDFISRLTGKSDIALDELPV